MRRLRTAKIGFALAAAILLLCCGIAAAQDKADQAIRVTVPEAVFPGEAFLVTVNGPGLQGVRVDWRKKVLSFPAASGAPVEFLLPVPYGAKAGSSVTVSMRIAVGGQEVAVRRSVPIKAKAYPKQVLSVDPRFVKLNAKDLARSRSEQAVVRPLLDALTPERRWSLPLERPVGGGVSSPYGVSRVFNGEPRGHHRGLDLRGATGTPIRASADGTVALAANHFFSGNVVYIDHGQGVVTLYAHMSKIGVKTGDSVRAGDVIGYVGSTGRVTGPHLHLGLVVQGESVDPAPLLKKTFAAPTRRATGATGKAPAGTGKAQGK